MEASDFQKRSGHSIRVYERLVKICTDTGLPLNGIIESLLIYFAKLDDHERIKLLVENDPEKVNFSLFKDPKENYAEKATTLAKEQLGNRSLSRISSKSLIAIGLGLLLLFGFFLSSDKKIE